MRPGKQFEDEAGRALKHLGAYRLNQNEEHGACDWVAFHRGMGVVIECKESRKASISFGVISERERSQLDAVTSTGGLGLVLVKWIGSNWSRAFAATWSDWKVLEAGPRRSIPLVDHQRPDQLLELKRIQRTHGLGSTWDLGPCLDDKVATWARGLAS